MPSFDRGRTKDHGDFLTFQELSLRWRNSLDRDQRHPLAGGEHFGHLPAHILKEGAQRGQPLVATAHLVLTVFFEILEKSLAALEGEILDGQPSVFVQTSEGFAPRPVTLARSNTTHVEITAGLQPGELYAVTETFLLKAELGKPKDTDD